ncbi:MAG: hypothetical protein QG608_2606 [Actinomycetota bacterium]|nr:hypothetical protein [Actinomycetota bacterium]
MINRYSATMTQQADNRVHVRVLMSDPIAQALEELGRRLADVPELRDRCTHVQREVCGEPYAPVAHGVGSDPRNEAWEIAGCSGKVAWVLAETLISWIVETGRGLRILIRGTQAIPLLVELSASRLRARRGRETAAAVFELAHRLGFEREAVPCDGHGPYPPIGARPVASGSGDDRRSVPIGENDVP